MTIKLSTAPGWLEILLQSVRDFLDLTHQGQISSTVPSRKVRRRVCRHQSTNATQYIKCKYIFCIQSFFWEKHKRLSFFFSWSYQCEKVSEYLQKRTDILGSPIQTNFGSKNSTYMSTVVGTKYELTCPHGKIKNPETYQQLVCLPFRQIGLEPPGNRQCSGKYHKQLAG